MFALSMLQQDCNIAKSGITHFGLPECITAGLPAMNGHAVVDPMVPFDTCTDQRHGLRLVLCGRPAGR